MSQVHRFVVPSDQDPERLDRCLAGLQKRWTRSRVRRLIDQGRVTLNDLPARPAAVARGGDVMVVDEPDPEPARVAGEDIPLRILYEDEHLLVLDKPAGMVVHPAAGNPSGTLVNALLNHCKDLSGIGGVERPGIVHRLDKDTTGLLVGAKHDRAHNALALAFRWRKVDKTYLAVCFGEPRSDSGAIDGPIARHPSERQQMAVVSRSSVAENPRGDRAAENPRGGRAARTLFRVEQRLGGTAVLSCRPITGRTHQIRVHLAHIGHALVGDRIYAGRQWRNLAVPGAVAACRSFPRQALHAWRLEFTHPITAKAMTFAAPLPADLKQLLAALGAEMTGLQPTQVGRPGL